MEETDSFEKVSILLCGITSKSFMITSMGSWNLMVSRLSHQIVGRDWYMQTVLYHDQNVTTNSVLVKWSVLYPAFLSLWLNLGSMDFILCVFIFINSFLQSLSVGWVHGLVLLVSFSASFFALVLGNHAYFSICYCVFSVHPIDRSCC